MSFGDPDKVWDLIQRMYFDITQSVNNKIGDFRTTIDILTSEYSPATEKFSALFELMARYRTSDVGTLIQERFDAYASDLKHNERQFLIIQNFESEFSFLFKPRKITIDLPDGSTKEEEQEYDPGLVRAMMDTKGSSTESLSQQKSNIMIEYLITCRKILDDADLRIYPGQTTIGDVASKATETESQTTAWLDKLRQLKKEEKNKDV